MILDSFMGLFFCSSAEISGSKQFYGVYTDDTSLWPQPYALFSYLGQWVKFLIEPPQSVKGKPAVALHLPSWVPTFAQSPSD